MGNYRWIARGHRSDLHQSGGNYFQQGEVVTMTHCPKCFHEQSNQVECEACGVIFSKFEIVQERRRLQAEATGCRKAESTGTVSRIAVVIVLVTITALFTYKCMFDRNTPQVEGTPYPTLHGTAVEGKTSSPFQGAGSVRQVPNGEPAVISGTPIEQARNGTVSIETPWGSGSGFFITDTTIVTNKHVVSPDRSQAKEVRHKVETGRKLIELEKEKNDELRSQLNTLADGPSRKQLVIILQERERNLAKILPRQEESEASLRSMEQSGSPADVKVFLVDGSVFSVQSIQASPNRDLALLTVPSTRATALRLAPKNSSLHQGDRVYAVGNPVGLRNTVTSGIFSGYRKNEATREVMLQTDAPINPGNSGGPLIDEHGFVHGINTMIISGTQGIGFAIPIQTVAEEFLISQQ
ncbi:MAG: trypsin-like serine protease [Deltaproteobacteria bacterium]|nr:trypsin-like serine protease [Deltaproteobacteria bacterium]